MSIFSWYTSTNNSRVKDVGTSFYSSYTYLQVSYQRILARVNNIGTSFISWCTPKKSSWQYLRSGNISFIFHILILIFFFHNPWYTPTNHEWVIVQIKVWIRHLVVHNKIFMFINNSCWIKCGIHTNISPLSYKCGHISNLSYP